MAGRRGRNRVRRRRQGLVGRGYARPAPFLRDAGPRPTSTADLISTLKDLLPEAKVTEPDGKHLYEELGPHATVVYDDGNGPAALTIGFSRFEAGAQSELTIGCPTKSSDYQFDSCVTTWLPDPNGHDHGPDRSAPSTPAPMAP
ncbi:hypothetical protein [Streptomyces regalis]|uniref:Uncharacterized protein n=1 Tax=Streptomyces regalis TaxID=68262 RepID=A0A0X3VM64_9ACTN|nr:hypothetical protein [Streptomyces regalis]KUL45891.1 hypothetical protein ADL12_02890 [Streptomyces regalis]